MTHLFAALASTGLFGLAASSVLQQLATLVA